MPNNFLNGGTPGDIASIASTLVGLDLGLAATISSDLAADFQSGSGLTVNVRVPGALPIRSRPIGEKIVPITLDEINEQFIPVTLADHLYTGVGLSEADLNLNISDFATQVLGVQTRSFGRDIDAKVAAAMMATPLTAAATTAPPTATQVPTYSAAAPARSFTAARRILRNNGVPAEAPLLAVVGSSVFADLLDAPAGTFDADGRVRGISVTESTAIPANAVIVYVANAFSLVVRAPAVPQGAAFGQSVVTPRTVSASGVVTPGFGLRWIMDYSGDVLADRSIVSTFYAVKAMPLAVDKTAAGATTAAVSLVDNGGAVRFSA